MKAVFLRNLKGFTGHASLYELDEEIGYGMDWNEPGKPAGYTRHVVVSATDVMDGPETYIFPADGDGVVLSWQEMPGSYRGGLDHAEALRRMGATIYDQRGQACETPLIELLERVPEDARAWYEHGPMNHSHIPYGLLCRRAAAEIRSLTTKLDQCLRVVREYVSSELADDPSQDAPSCELYPLIELVRNTTVK